MSEPVTGSLYGICEPIEKLQALNKKVFPVLEQLRVRSNFDNDSVSQLTPFFQTYKVNMENECPFWAIQRMCNSKKCAICECSENEIPSFWKNQLQESSEGMFGHALQSTQNDCPQSMSEWCAEEEHDPKAVYVNIAKNRESYTAYEGQQIWNAIYEENCLLENIKDIDLENTCTEETLLYQLVSGLHTSINMHVTTHFTDISNKNSNLTYPDHSRYHTAIGVHPERLKNMYFLYAVVLRAVNRAEPILRSYEYQTELDIGQDNETLSIANQLLDITLTNCEAPFQEDQLFTGKHSDAFHNEVMLKEIQTKFFNISRIIDCVSCEKCRFNGKVQIKGLGTALKLLFSRSQSQSSLNSLRRTELIVSLTLMFHQVYRHLSI